MIKIRVSNSFANLDQVSSQLKYDLDQALEQDFKSFFQPLADLQNLVHN